MRAFWGFVLLFFLCVGPATALAEHWPDLSTSFEAKAEGSKDSALIIGIGDYLLAPDVEGATKNADDWYRFLTRVRGVPAENVVLLRDVEGTLETIRERAAAIAARSKRGGTLWIVFIGHGAPAKDGKDGLLVGVDAQQTATSLYARSLPQRELVELVEGGEQARTVLVIDACFSGKIGKDEQLAGGLQPMLPVQQQGGAVIVFRAGGSDEFAGSLPRLGRPAFSYLLLGALRGWGDEDNDGDVSASEAISYTRATLRVLAKDRKQTPERHGGVGTSLLSRGVQESGPDLTAMVLSRGERRRVIEPRPVEGGDMVEVEAGRFLMGCASSNERCGANEGAAREVLLERYAISRTEVTVAAYRACVEAGGCTAPARVHGLCHWGKRRRDHHPVNCVRWDQAESYCRWRGARLPTEAEWEKAARGSDERSYPWGDAGDYCQNTVMEGCPGFAQPVGSRPGGASPSGALDMGGNLSEWTADWYLNTYYKGAPTEDPRGPVHGVERAVRGGSFISADVSALRVSRRQGKVPTLAARLTPRSS